MKRVNTKPMGLNLTYRLTLALYQYEAAPVSSNAGLDLARVKTFVLKRYLLDLESARPSPTHRG